MYKSDNVKFMQRIEKVFVPPFCGGTVEVRVQSNSGVSWVPCRDFPKENRNKTPILIIK